MISMVSQYIKQITITETILVICSNNYKWLYGLTSAIRTIVKIFLVSCNICESEMINYYKIFFVK